MSTAVKAGRIDIARIRREQIVDAAVAVIAEQGLQNLSLSEIEKKVGMSRGQLTYYFPAKEEILLAVFDRLLLLMGRQAGIDRDGQERDFLKVLEQLLRMLLAQPAANPEFQALHFTFLSQVGHRADFRRRLAQLYEEWRRACAEDIAAAQARDPGAAVEPRTLATLVQALLHGLVIQAAVDPAAFDAEEVIRLTLDVIGTYLKRRPAKTPRPNPSRTGA